MDFAYSRPFLYTVISSFRKDTVIFLYKEEKWRKYKIMSNIRIFDIPDEVQENESYKRISRRLNATKKTDRDLCNHIISTANFAYMYCTQYEKEDTVDRSDAFVAALLFNFWKIIAPKTENREKNQEEERKLAQISCAAQKDIVKNTPENITNILYVKDEVGQHIHEIIYTCNALDNIMCLKGSDGKPFSIPTVLSIMSSSKNFRPSIVKNLRNFFIRNIEAYAEEFKVSFSSKDEMRAFDELSGDAKEALFAAVSTVLKTNGRPVAIKELNLSAASDLNQVVMFTSDPNKVVKFYDRRTQSLYEI